MSTTTRPPQLPKQWPKLVHNAFTQATALAHHALVVSRAWAANSPIERVRLRGDNAGLTAEIDILHRELAIKNAKASRVPPHKRMHFTPEERLSILTLRAAAGWTAVETAKRFGVNPQTIGSWTAATMDVNTTLLHTREPVNKYPDFVALLVEQLKAAAPTLGTRKIADYFARAALHLGASTVKRILDRAKAKPKAPPPHRPAPPPSPTSKSRIVAKYPNHIWSLDLTTVPTVLGLHVPWWPNSWVMFPFAWVVLVVMDHFTRRIVHTQAFRKNPSTKQITAGLDKLFRDGVVPKHMISDQGSQFQDQYAEWCKRRGIKPRWGAIGKHGSIAVTERTILSLKSELLRLVRVPLSDRAMALLLANHRQWFCEHRPHATLGGLTPSERLKPVRQAARNKKRIEPRARYPDRPGARKRRPVRLELVVRCVGEVKELVTVALRAVALVLLWGWGRAELCLVVARDACEWCLAKIWLNCGSRFLSVFRLRISLEQHRRSGSPSNLAIPVGLPTKDRRGSIGSSTLGFPQRHSSSQDRYRCRQDDGRFLGLGRGPRLEGASGQRHRTSAPSVANLA